MSAAVQLVRTEQEAFAFEVASRPIPPLLAPHVRSWTGYVERTQAPLRRRELPGPQFVLIFEFGPPIQVYESGGESNATRYPGGFVAGLDDAFSLTEHAGYQAGLELKLTPLGAHTLFGVPLSELSRTVLQATDLLPRTHRTFADRLASARSWDARFDLVERLLLEAVRSADTQLPAAIWAARRIEAAAGAVDIGSLCDELGYSHKHVLSLFREHVGFPPKLYARLTRFDATIRQLRTASEPLLDRGWAAVAMDRGYADQSHLVRELKHFSGLTPNQLIRVLQGYPM